MAGSRPLTVTPQHLPPALMLCGNGLGQPHALPGRRTQAHGFTLMSGNLTSCAGS